MMAYNVYSNGKSISDKQTLDLLQEENAGIFESMRVYAGKVFLLEDHLARLRESAKTVGYEPIPDPREMRKEVESALRASGAKNSSLRLTLLDGEAFAIIGNREIPEKLYKTGVPLKTSSFPRGSGNAFPYQAKMSSYQQAILASTEPDPGEAFDRIFLDRGNYLTETRTANFFLVRHLPELKKIRQNTGSRDRETLGGKAELLTPPEHLILNGVTRRFVIKCALDSGFKVRESILTRHDFFNAAEAFLTNTSWEILPVRELDGRAVGEKVPGPVTKGLHSLYKRRVRKLCLKK